MKQTEERQIPVRIVGFIIAFLNNTISQPEQIELDDWISSSEENVMIFEDLIETADLQEILIPPSLVTDFEGRLN